MDYHLSMFEKKTKSIIWIHGLHILLLLYMPYLIWRYFFPFTFDQKLNFKQLNLGKKQNLTSLLFHAGVRKFLLFQKKIWGQSIATNNKSEYLPIFTEKTSHRLQGDETKTCLWDQHSLLSLLYSRGSEFQQNARHTHIFWNSQSMFWHVMIRRRTLCVDGGWCCTGTNCAFSSNLFHRQIDSEKNVALEKFLE